MAVGMYGNAIYLDKAKKDIHKIKNITGDSNTLENDIKAKGGTNLAFAIIYAVIEVILCIILTLLFG